MAEQAAVLEVLHSPRFVDAAPAEVYATLLDDGVYLASERTMYRLLAQVGESGERRKHRSHPVYHKPELLATGPNQVWSWDITKLLGPQKWTYFYLYVILDIFSRYVVGWTECIRRYMVAHQELAALAERLIAETAAKQQIPPGQLTLHADRGSSMTSKPVAFLLADLGDHQDPFPALRLPCLSGERKERQPLFGEPVQDPEVPARLPGALRRVRGTARPSAEGPGVLPLV
jgi:putative transposase